MEGREAAREGGRGGGNHVQVVSFFPFFAPVRNEQLGLCLLIIRLVWFSLFVFQEPLRLAVTAAAAQQ